jgi:hypothetical protein
MSDPYFFLPIDPYFFLPISEPARRVQAGATAYDILNNNLKNNGT